MLEHPSHGCTLMATTLLLASCSTPFGDRLTNIDWKPEPVAGTIAVSQPKVYRRESLINERREDVAWIETQIKKSETDVFTPEIVRETEVITSLAAALGLSFDPAAGVNYRRASETGEMQQEIEAMRLQLQLDQLRRDAQLVRDRFAAQTEPVNADLGKLPAGSPPAVTSTAGPAAAAQLTEAVDRIKTALATQFGTDAREPAVSKITTNPSELFRDRSAYRDVLKAARNAASLDDLHDQGGNALIRLNFQAVVLPDRDHSRVPGVVQMSVRLPALKRAEKERVYRGWLDYINQKINVANGSGWKPNVELVSSKAADSFDLVPYYYLRRPLAPGAETVQPAKGAVAMGRAAGAKGKAEKDKAAAVAREGVAAGSKAGVAAQCTGLTLTDDMDVGTIEALRGEDESRPCGKLVFAVPKFAGGSAQEGVYSQLSNYMGEFALHLSDEADQKLFDDVHRNMGNNVGEVVHNCGLPRAASTGTNPVPTEPQKLENAIRRAQARVATADQLASLDRLAYDILQRAKMPPATVTDQAQRIARRAAHARYFLGSFEAVAYRDCAPEKRQAFRDSLPALYIPLGFQDLFGETPRVAVYEIGPREQVQQVSSVSRVANSLSMAVSLAATKPGSGAGASAAADYSRQAMGRAATLERIPALIGYAARNQTFGWVVTPKAVFGPKGKIQLEQTPRTLDLSVDLSVPAWWPRFTIDITTGWATGTGPVTDGKIALAVHDHLEVPLAQNYSDFTELTAQFKRSLFIREASLDQDALNDQFVAACRQSSLYLRGANVWRATSVVIGGHRLDEAAMTVAPDMSGVLLTVPALEKQVADTFASRIPVSVFTRHGRANAEIPYIPAPVPGGCKPPDKAAPDGPVIASVSPAEFQRGAEQYFTVTGTKLDRVDEVTLGSQPGTIIKRADDGTELRLKFAAVNTNIPSSRAVPLAFFSDKKPLGHKNVESRD